MIKYPCSNNDNNSELYKQLNLNVFQYSEKRFVDNEIDSDINFYNQIQVSCKYYTDCEISTCIVDNFTILYVNCRSLKANFRNLLLFLESLNHRFDVIGLCETWLNDDDHAYFNINGYTANFVSRNHKIGGGVALYTKSNYSVNCLEKISASQPIYDNHDTVETVFIELDTSSNVNKTVIGCVYNPPNKCITKFNDYIESILNKLKNKKVYIGGDFNINLLNNETHIPTSQFVDTMLRNGFYPCITHPTRITDHSCTLIDHIYTNSLEDNTNSGIILSSISDHYPVFICKPILTTDSNRVVQKTKRDFSTCNIQSFNDKLANTQWDTVLGEDGVENLYEKFITKYQYLYNESFPIRVFKVAHKDKKLKPWFTKGLINSCRKKQTLYRRYLKNKTLENVNRYKKYKNKLVSVLRAAEKHYYSTKIEDYKGNVKGTWRILKQIVNKCRNQTYCQSFKHNNGNIVDKYLITEKFNEFFTNVGPTLASKIPKVENDPLSYLSGDYRNSFYLTPVTEPEILKMIANENRDKACGHDEISVNIVKSVARNISYPLCKIFNASFSDGRVPSSMKIAKVIPIFKAGEKSNFTNYRPVSVLPFFSKLLEKLYHSRLNNYVNKHNILSSSQYGFRDKSSTQYALLDLVESLSTAIDDNKFTVGVFIDLRKAFDTIDHDILLRKLYFYGVRGLAYDWVKDYLSSRTQYVQYNNECSSRRNINCGVPQGSILGPLCFILYINDICNVSDILKIILFADDTNLFYSDTNLDRLYGTMNRELKKLVVWFKTNRLSLNVDKTNYILFKSKNKKIDKELKVEIEGNILLCVPYTKFLGVYIDESLSWVNHINLVENKISKNIGVLYRVSKILDSKSLYTLYCSLVLPYMYYCVVLWGNNYQSKIDNVIKLQKKAIRIISRASFNEHTLPLLKRLNALSFQDIVKVTTLVIMYKVYNHLVPTNIELLFDLQSEVHSYSTRSSTNKNFHVRYVRTNTKKFTLGHIGPTVWFNLNVEIKESKSVFSFKKHLKRMIINNY